MSNDLESVINARLEKAQKELSVLDAKKKAALAPFAVRGAELAKEINFYLDMKREAGILPAAKPKGNPAFRKKPAE